MAGAATLTTVESSRSMHSAARTTKRMSQRRGWPAAGGALTDGARVADTVEDSLSNTVRYERTAF